MKYVLQNELKMGLVAMYTINNVTNIIQFLKGMITTFVITAPFK